MVPAIAPLSFLGQFTDTPSHAGVGGLPARRSVWNKKDNAAVLPEKAMISIVDDDKQFRDSVKRLMKSVGYVTVAFASATEFLESPYVEQTNCLITDINMPGMSGVELYQRLMEAGRTIPTILITAYPDDSVRERALKDGVCCYLRKPFRENELIGCVRAAIDKISL